MDYHDIGWVLVWGTIIATVVVAVPLAIWDIVKGED